MSRRFCTDERGQALVELVLAALLLVPLLLVAYHLSRLLVARLELVSLTREAALYMIHESKSEMPADVLKELASRTRLDPEKVSAKVEGASLGSLTGGGSGSKIETFFFSMLLGSRLTLHYTISFSGVPALWMPDGMELSETVVLQSGTWKNLGLGKLS